MLHGAYHFESRRGGSAMRRLLLCSCLALLLCGVTALAAEKRGVVTAINDVDKLDEGKTTIVFKEVDKKEKKFVAPVTLPVSKDVKVLWVPYGKEPFAPVEGGLKNKMF